MKFLIKNKLSKVPSDLWTDIDSRLGKIFMMIPEKAFARLLVMTRWLALTISSQRKTCIF